MLFAATPVAAGDWEDASAAYQAGDYQKAFRLRKRAAEQRHTGRGHGLAGPGNA